MGEIRGTGKDRILGYCLLRVIASVAIVILHTANVAEILYREQISDTQDMVSMTVVYGMMWAVPCFVMVTGALLLDPARRMSLKKIYGSYVLRALADLTLFVLVFRLFDAGMNGDSIDALLILDAIEKLVTGKSWSHLWYLYTLLGLYMMLPIYRAVTAQVGDAGWKPQATDAGLEPRTEDAPRKGQELICYLLALYAVFLSLMPLTKCFGVTSRFEIPVSGIYPFYFFAGYALAQGILRITKRTAAVLLLLGEAGIVLCGILRYRYDIAAMDTVLSSYASPLVILTSVGMYALTVGAPATRQSAETGTGLRRFLYFLDGNGLGIYLIHMIWLRLVLRYQAVNPYALGAWSWVAIVVGSYAASCLLTWLLRHVPLIRRVL